MKKGFTLVELLAVIVILAIIALIAVPQIMGVIDKARKGAAESSALGYIDAVEKYAMLHDIDSVKYPYDLKGNTWNVAENSSISFLDLFVDKVYAEDTMPALNTFIDVKGKKPTSGTITVDNKNKVTNANMCMSGYTVVYNGREVTSTTKGCSSSSSSSEEPSTPEPAQVTYAAYSIGQSINYNPVSGELCDSPTSTPGTKTGCMKWYVIKESGTSDETVDVILDHNTTALVAWNSERTNTEMKEVATQLATDATGWTTGLNPRLITADEVAHIVGADRNDTIKWSSSKGYGSKDIETKSSWIYLDGGRNSDPTVYASGSNGWQKKYANSSTPSNYAWLFDYTNGCELHGCSEEDSSNQGYWTSSPVSGSSSRAWRVSSVGYLKDDYMVDFDNYCGVRPVIEIPKSLIQ